MLIWIIHRKKFGPYLASSSAFSLTAWAIVSASWYFFLLFVSSFTDSWSSAWTTVSCSIHCGQKQKRNLHVWKTLSPHCNSWHTCKCLLNYNLQNMWQESCKSGACYTGAVMASHERWGWTRAALWPQAEERGQQKPESNAGCVSAALSHGGLRPWTSRHAVLQITHRLWWELTGTLFITKLISDTPAVDIKFLLEVTEASLTGQRTRESIYYCWYHW